MGIAPLRACRKGKWQTESEGKQLQAEVIISPLFVGLGLDWIALCLKSCVRGYWTCAVTPCH